MKTRRARVAQRLGVIVAAVVVAGSYFTGAAFAQDDNDPSTTLPEISIPVSVPTSVPISIPTSIPISIPTSLPISIPTGLPGTTTASGPSGANTVIQYSPYPYPVFGDYGHRYYGKYYDRGCGCDRYAAPTYVQQTVVATQVASVPKGGVDTGDGSFQ